jgi:phospholipid/cholesterol/gamma-HCH transport system permease protein
MLRTFLGTFGRTVLLSGKTFFWIFRNLFTLSFNIKNIFAQMAYIGADSLPIVSITGFFTGAVLVAQIGKEFVRFGAETYIGGVVTLSMAREMAPVLASIVVAGRVGASIAAEVGSMEVTEQIKALRTLATDPVDYIVVPRFLAAVFMLPVLTVFANILGSIGGALVAVYQIKINLVTYRESILRLLSITDITGGMWKAAVFGAVISIIACDRGLSTRGGAEGVGRSTTGSVVSSIILILILNYFLSTFLFNLSESVLR